jgi:Fe2+ or Zn2+ uptake regulation protein
MAKNQEIILKTIQSSDRHMTADEIYMKCREEESKMSIATVYRNLGIMVGKGLVAKISISGQPDHYDRSVVRHEHILCDCCGKIEDAKIDGLKDYLEEKIGVELKSYDLCMRYICQECQKKV